MSTDLTVQPQGNMALAVDAVLRRVTAVQDLMARAMVADVDFGKIPGTGSKPTLLKAGAEKLCVMFQFVPRYQTVKTFAADGHLTVESTCQIHDMDGRFLGEASTICTTRESKYAYRIADRVCPQCGKPAIKRSKFPPRDQQDQEPGWYCFAKVGGCGHNFSADDPTISTQLTGRIPNPDLADAYNTVLRIAEKRAYIAAVRLVTGCSSLFDEEPATASDEHDHSQPIKPRAASQKQSQQQPAPKPPAQPVITPAVQRLLDALGDDGGPGLDDFNDLVAKGRDLQGDDRVSAGDVGLWKMIREYGRARGWQYDQDSKVWSAGMGAEAGAEA